jgi:hypothetical protein
MNKLIIILSLILLLTLTSCIVDSSWLGIVGCWQDIEYPDMGVEFTKSGQFSDYFYGKVVSYGEFEAEGDNITLNYLSECGNNGLSCTVKLGFTVTEDSLIITDSQGDIRHKKVDCQSLNY